MAGPRRRRRRINRPRNTPRRWRQGGVLAAVLTLGAALYFILVRSPFSPTGIAAVEQVQSTVTQDGDSLQIIVRWRLAKGIWNIGRPESLRVEVRTDSMGATAARVRVLSGVRQRDTVYVPAPPPGASIDGRSCVAPQRGAGISRETCTPWRYVQPLAQAPPPVSGAIRNGVSPNEPVRIVVRPRGLQVDPDIDGKCAAWQRRYPSASVWVEVNRVAIPPCTGPNNRPTVAQFCAFAVLGNGRRVKTTNSANNPYCDRLFEIWARERVS